MAIENYQRDILERLTAWVERKMQNAGFGTVYSEATREWPEEFKL